MPRSPKLAELLSRHAERLGDCWTKSIRELPGSHYRERPEREIREWAGRGLAAVIRSLDSGDVEPLQDHLQRLVRTRGRLGFEIEEVLLALSLLDRCALPFLMEEYPDDPDELGRMVSTLDDCVDAAVARFGALFAEAMRERVESERRNTACLLEALEEVAGTAALPSALELAAHHIGSALAASQCAVFVRQGNGEEHFVLGATWGEARSPFVEACLDRTFQPDSVLAETLVRQRARVYRVGDDCSFLGEKISERSNLEAVVVLPVRSRGTLVAMALALYASGREGPNNDRLRLAQAMAHSLGSVIDNARLFAESQRGLVESGTLQQISSALLEESGLADMLDLICRECLRLVSATGVVV